MTLEEYLGEDNELVKILDQAKGDMKMARELAGDNHYSLNWVQSTLGTFRLADADGDGALDSGEFFQCVSPPALCSVSSRSAATVGRGQHSLSRNTTYCGDKRVELGWQPSHTGIRTAAPATTPQRTKRASE